MKQVNKIAHTLGIDIYHAKHSKSKRDKYLPEEFYRNYYNYGRVGVDAEPDWIKDIEHYIDKWEQHGLYYFQINEKGIEAFKQYFQVEVTDNYVPLSRGKQRYQNWLEADCGLTFAEYLGIK